MIKSIAILATTFPRRKDDWVCSSVYELSKGLVAEGLKVHVVTPHHPGLKKRETVEGITIHRFQYMFPARLQAFSYDEMGLLWHLKRGILPKIQFIFYLAAFFLKSLAVCREVDLVHAQWLPAGLIAVLVKSIIRKPVVLTPRGFTKVYSFCYPPGTASSLQNRFLRKIVKLTLSGCDRISVTSSPVAELVLRFGVAKDKVKVIPNWVDVGKTSVIRKESDRQRLGMDGAKRLILFVGRLSPEKGLEYLVEAVNSLRDREYMTVLAGDGPERARLAGMIEEKNLSSRVELLGALPHAEVSRWMEAADVFVLPSLYEEFGVVLLEAMVRGTPVIGSSVGGIPDIITPEAGFLVPPEDPRALAEKIELLLEDDQLRLEMGKNARLRVERHFTWKAIRETLLAVYRDAGL